MNLARAAARLLAVTCVLGLTAAPASAADLDLETLDGPTAVKLMEEGKLTSVELTRAYIARIAALNKRGPGLNAVTQLNPQAIKDAALLDKERKEGQAPRPRARPADPAQGPDRREGHVHVGGQLLAAQLLPGDRLGHGQEAARARRRDPRQARPLRVREHFGSQPSGFSNLTGQVLNGLDADQNPSGSSSGSGSAGAAALSTLTIGTETSGSIISPSQANGLVGLRPTVGLVPGYGIAPISASQDTAGPMDRTVANAAMTLQSIAGPDPHDAEYYRGICGPATSDAESSRPPGDGAELPVRAGPELRARQAHRLQRHAHRRARR